MNTEQPKNTREEDLLREQTELKKVLAEATAAANKLRGIETTPTTETSPPLPKTVAEGEIEIENDKAREEYFNLLKNKKPKKGTPENAIYEADLKAKKEIYGTTKNIKVKEFLDKGDKEGAQAFLLGEVELKRKNDLENGPRWEKIKTGVSKGITYWEGIGKNPDDSKNVRRLKQIGKTMIAVALIGGTSVGIVSALSTAGIGTAAAVSGSYFGRKLGTSVGFSAAMSVLPDSMKPLASKLALGLAATSMAGAIGLGASKFSGWATKKWWSEKAIAEKTNVEMGKLDINLETLDTDLKKYEQECEKIIKEAEKKRTYRRLLSGAVALTASIVFLETAGYKTEPHNAQVEKTQLEVHEKPHTDSLKHETPSADDLKHEPHLGGFKAVTPSLETPSTSTHETPNMHENTVNQDAIVHKGEGIENAFIRQIEHDPKLAQALGFNGNDPKELHTFAQHQAHILAKNEGYVDNSGHEVRVAEADKVAYEIKIENGQPVVTERMSDGTLVEIHHKGDAFEQKIESYEYKGSGQHGTIHHDVTHNTAVETGTHTAPTEGRHDISENLSEGNASAKPATEDLGMWSGLKSVEIKQQGSAGNFPFGTVNEHGRGVNFAHGTVNEHGRGANYVHGTGFRHVNRNLYGGYGAEHGHYFPGLSPEDNTFLNNHSGFVGENLWNLNGEKLIETYQFHQENIHHIFPQDTKAVWNMVSTGPVREMMATPEAGAEPGISSFISYLHKLETVTGQHPYRGIFKRVETNEEYVGRALQYAAKHNLLNEVRY